MPLDTKSQSTAISNQIATLHREHYGRGAERVRTIIHSDYVVTLLEEPFTPVERMLASNGDFAQVRDTRTKFQDWMSDSFTQVVEQETGRRVRAFFSQVSAEPPMSMEFFVLEPVSGDGRVDGNVAVSGDGRVDGNVA